MPSKVAGPMGARRGSDGSPWDRILRARWLPPRRCPLRLARAPGSPQIRRLLLAGRLRMQPALPLQLPISAAAPPHVDRLFSRASSNRRNALSKPLMSPVCWIQTASSSWRRLIRPASVARTSLRPLSSSSSAAMLHHLMVGTWTPPGAIFTLQFDDEALTLKLIKKTEIPNDEPISWITFDVRILAGLSSPRPMSMGERALTRDHSMLGKTSMELP